MTEGNITGERNHVTYMGPSSTTTPKNGLVKLELDNELIQGATVEVEYEIKVTSNKLFAGILRMIVSLLKTPYCTGIGQVTSSIYQFVTVNIIFHRNFRIDKNGIVIKKGEENENICTNKLEC